MTVPKILLVGLRLLYTISFWRDRDGKLCSLCRCSRRISHDDWPAQFVIHRQRLLQSGATT